eukprot:1537129-Ditylum_brightwellii.AAC.1
MGGLLQRQGGRSMLQAVQRETLNPWSSLSQKERFSKKTRAPHAETDDDVEMEKFCLGMNYYFTLPKVIKGLRDNGIAVVETTRFRKGCPPCALQQIQQKDCDFNEF